MAISRLQLSQKAACVHSAHLHNNQTFLVSLRISDYSKEQATLDFRSINTLSDVDFSDRVAIGLARLPKLRQIRAIKLFCGLQSSSRGGQWSNLGEILQ